VATYRKRGMSWYAEVRKQGVRQSASFSTKAEARAWANHIETEIEQNRIVQGGKLTLRDMLEKYIRQESIKKKTYQNERMKLSRFFRDFEDLANLPLADVTATHIGEWRDRRLRQVSASTVRREWVILSHAFRIAMREWKLIGHHPMAEVRRPQEKAPRNRRPTEDEIWRLAWALGWNEERAIRRPGHFAAAAWLFAIETAMRASEITNLTWEHVHDRHVHLPMTKNGTSRNVPLTTTARQILSRLPREDAPVFQLTPQRLDALFRKAKARCKIEDLHFHDSRREALTRLSKKFDVMELSKVSGHRDLRILQGTYYAPTIDDLADKLD
jgi:integrase